MVNSTFSAAMLGGRVRAGLSIEEASQRAGIPSDAWAKMEADRLRPANKLVVAIAKALQLDPFELMACLEASQLGRPRKSVGTSKPGAVRFGWAEGKIHLKSNFDDPIPGMEEYV